VRTHIPLFVDRELVMGDDLQPTTVTLCFEVSNHGQKQIRLQVFGDQYPRSSMPSTTRLNLIAKQPPPPRATSSSSNSDDHAPRHQEAQEAQTAAQRPAAGVHGTGDDGPILDLHGAAGHRHRHRHRQTDLPVHGAGDDHDGLVVPTFAYDQVSQYCALMVNDDYTDNAAIRVGRQLSAQVCVCVCVCVCVWIIGSTLCVIEGEQLVYASMYVCVCVYDAYVRASMHTCIHTCTHTHVHTYVHPYTHAYTHIPQTYNTHRAYSVTDYLEKISLACSRVSLSLSLLSLSLSLSLSRLTAGASSYFRLSLGRIWPIHSWQ